MIRRVLILLACVLAWATPVYAQAALFDGQAAFPQFFDNSGTELAGGTVNFFLSTTTTPATVYADATLSTPLGMTPGVVPLDGSGRTPVVYLSAVAYKVVLKDSGGSTIATADPVYGAAYLGLLAATPTIQTTTSTGTVNDFALSSTTAPVIILRCNNATDLTITGFVAGTAGQTVIVQSVGAGNVFLAPQTGSSAANRIITFLTTPSLTPLAAGSGVAAVVRDGTTARWRLQTHDQGAPISWTPTLAFGGASVNLTYGTQAAVYFVSGRRVFVEGRIALTNKGASTGSATITTLPYAVATASFGTEGLVDFAVAGVGLTGTPYVIANGSSLLLVQTSATVRGVLTEANFTNTTDIRLGVWYYTP